AACDSGAYFIGKLMGKTPFSPTSPNKTLEGVIGGLICASVIGTILGIFVYSFWLSLLCSFFVAIFAVIGDLFESYFKREAGVKDSGDLIPGHGGVLDRIDAVIIAAFVMVTFL
ncbi:phosphatidate cytidylyltransferase, partial [Campylobacter jejuni]